MSTVQEEINTEVAEKGRQEKVADFLSWGKVKNLYDLLGLKEAKIKG